MPYTLSWYQPNRVVLLKVEGLFTITETRSLLADSLSYIVDATQLVHFLVDTSALQKIESLTEGLKIVQSTSPPAKMGWMIIIGRMNPLFKFAFDFTGLLTHSRYRRFDTMSEAVDFLKEIDGTLILG